MNILFTGGGSSGPVSPLLAIAEEIKKSHPHAKFLFVGTSHGPERAMVESAKITFVSIAAGKWRRYFSLANMATPFLVIAGFFQSFGIIRKFKPDCVVGAGGFVQVPLMWAARLLNVPILIHQQDIVPTLANKLCAPIASKITLTFEQSLRDFPQGLGLFYGKPYNKVLVTGNPFREMLKSYTKEQGLETFGLTTELPVLYAFGGGTGAEGINSILVSALPELSKIVQIIHSVGKGKHKNVKFPHYHSFEFISEQGAAYAAADIVVCRAGLATLTELSNLAKIAIIIPMPNSHQEFNAELVQSHGAAIVVDQDALTPEMLVKVIRKIIFSLELQKFLSNNIKKIMPHHGTKLIAEEVVALAEQPNG